MSVYSDQHWHPPLFELRRQHGAPVIIETIELLRFEGTYLVRARSVDGAAGIAVCNARARYLYPMVKELVIPAFIGHDARDLESLVNDVYIFRSNYKYAGTPFWNCVAYVEAALLDLLGKAAEASVGDLLGGPWRGDIPIYLSSMRRDTTPEEEVAWVGERLEATGAKAVKLKIGGRMLNDADSIPGRTETMVPLARKTWGNDVTLYVDANGSYGRDKAVEVGRLLEAHDYGWLEEPCPFEQYEETKAVADALDIDVAGGEQDCNLAHFRMMIRTRTVDMVQPDLMYNGGLIRALRVAEMARTAGLRVTPHSPKHNPELATLLHFASLLRHTGPYMEFPAVDVAHEDWYRPHFEIKPGGYIDVPRGPGLGITYDDGIWEKAELV